MSERFWELVTRQLAASISPEEQRELEVICNQHPELLQLHVSLTQYWNNPPTQQVDAEALLQSHLLRMAQRFPEFSQDKPIEKPRRFLFSSKIWWSVAASLIVMAAYVLWRMAMPAYLSAPMAKTMPMVNEVTTPPGNRSMLVLPDGTKVWVNANSRLAYDVGFGKDNRNLTLNGEAYFIAAKNKDLPLIINTEQMVVRVTGTTFNVRAYDGDKVSETALFEGSITITAKADTTNSYKLKPNQKLVLDRVGTQVQQVASAPGAPHKEVQIPTKDKLDFPQITLKPLEVDPRDNMVFEAAWVNNTLAFSNESFAEIARKMENWYGVQIAFANQKIAEIRFTGKFTTEGIQEALEALQFTAKFSFKKDNKQIFIY
jgi:ferric-dicitrate binding protein FerR (iron transport regulator)